MHLDYVASFCRVVKVKSITKAAKELHLSQPALSLQINCLESRFRTKLLDRTNRGVKVTPAGEVLFRHGQRLLKILHALESEFNQLQDPSSQRLTIYASPTIGTFLLPAALCSYASQHSQNKFSLSISCSDMIIEGLSDGTLDIGLVEGPLRQNEAQRLKAEKIMASQVGTDDIVLICSASQTLVESVDSLTQLCSVPLILPAEATGIRRAIDTELALHNCSVNDLNIVLELDNSNSIISAVCADKGMGLVPKTAVEDLLLKNVLHSIPNTACSFKLPFYILYPLQLTRNPVAESMINCITEAI